MSEKEHPILFSGSMVRAILAEQKTMTLCPVAVQQRDAGVDTYRFRPRTGVAGLAGHNFLRAGSAWAVGMAEENETTDFTDEHRLKRGEK